MNPEPVQTPPVPTPTPAPAPFDPSAAISKLRESGYNVYDKDYNFDPSTQIEDPFIKKIFGATTSHLYVGVDKDVFESTGVPKNPGEKTYDYIRRTGAQLKEQITKAPDVEAIKGEYENKLTAKDQAIAEISLRSAIGGLKLNVPDESVESQRELLVMRALSLPHRIEGSQIVYQKYAEGGGPLIDVIDPTTGRAMEPGKYLESQFKAFLAVEQPTPTGPGKPPKPADTATQVPTNMAELSAMLRAEGMTLGGPAYMDELKKRAIAYAITE